MNGILKGSGVNASSTDAIITQENGYKVFTFNNSEIFQ